RYVALGTVVDYLLAEGFRLAASAPVGLLVCSLGSLALGTQLFGQEFGNRTLGLLLSHPVRRRSVLLIKMGVLGAMVLSLAVASDVLRSADGADPNGLVQLRLALLLTVSGLFVAPWLTLLTRSSVAGFVFSIAVPGAIAVACELAATANPEQFNDIRLAGLSGGILVTSLAGAMSTAWMFTRVEAVEGGRAIGLAPAWRSTTSRTTVAPAHPIAQLFRKELHIQQMSFVLALLFVLASGSVGLFLYFTARSRPEVIETVATLYLMLLGVIAGSIPSAEERSLGTLQAQLLLPVSARTQWRVKAGVALGLVLALGVGLPSLVLWIAGSTEWWGRVWPAATAALILFTSLSLFVSSVSSNGIRALFGATVMAISAIFAFNWMEWTVFIIMDEWGRRSGLMFFPRFWHGWSSLLALVVISVVLLHLGSINHRASPRSPADIARQLGWISSVGVLLVVIIALGSAHWIPRPPGF
ncbi:MAG TPA: hypothetical protein VM493_08815, partial [Vicinamibacterales bacterium]|nr:hypothetical protein [Vicinamibacterales bacterium]